MSNIINIIAQKIQLKNFVKKKHDVLKQERHELFKQHGEGLFYVCFKAATSDWYSKAIGYFCKGLSHCFIVLYSENLRSWFTQDQWSKIEKKWKLYYGSLEGLDTCKVMVLASADSIGFNTFDFSEYQNRSMSIRKIPNEVYSRETQLKVAHWLLEVTHDMIYDYLGLIGYIISNKIHDKKNYYCSNEIYYAFKSQNIFIADCENPKPSHIQDYNHEWIVYNTL